jgi:anti-sigma B factor antagonist
MSYEAFPSFELMVGRHNGLATVVVTGELDLATAPELARALDEHGDAELLLVDLTATTFIDSTGVRMLIEADRRSVASGALLVIMAGEGPVRRVLELCELDGRLAVVSEDASRLNGRAATSRADRRP